MARTSRTASTATTSDNPLDWLFVHPASRSTSGIAYGVLRRDYQGRRNSAAEFGRHKLQPIAPAAGDAWTITAERCDVILPTDADDMLADPRTLLTLADATAAPVNPALLTYVTLPLRSGERLHQGWERARTFVQARLTSARGLAVLLVLHAPQRSGSAAPPHCHALIVPRRIGPLGLSQALYDPDLTHDRGRALVDDWWGAARW